LWERLYNRSAFLDRTYRFCLALRHTRGAQAESSKEAPQPYSLMKDKPWGSVFRDFSHLIRLSWAYGIRHSCRWQYWRYLLDIRRRNPSRLIRFLRNCSVGEGMMHLRDEVRVRMQSYLREKARRGTEADRESAAPVLK
jgi:hypothetical protein